MAIITEAITTQLTGAYADLDKAAMAVGQIAVPSDHVPIVRCDTDKWEELVTSESVGELIALSEKVQAQSDRLEDLIITKTNVNDAAANLTQSWSGSKTQSEFNAINTNLESQINQFSSNHKDGLISAGSGINPTNLNFDLVAIKKESDLSIPIYEIDFRTRYLNETLTPEFAVTKSVPEVGYTNSTSGLKITSTSADTTNLNFLKVRVPVKLDMPCLAVELDVLNDNNRSTQTKMGIRKDDKLIFFVYDKANSEALLQTYSNSTEHLNLFTYVAFTAPYTMVMYIHRNIATCCIKKDGVITKIGEYNFGQYVNINSTTAIKDYELSFQAGVKPSASGNLIIGGFRAKYTSGVVTGADFRTITYEDGCTIQNGNSIYVTASNRSIGGNNIYKLNLDSYKIEFVGFITGYNPTTSAYLATAAVKVMYDRNNKEFVVINSDFSTSNTKLVIAKTKRNLLTGIHALPSIDMQIPYISTRTWDADIIYTNNKYWLVYTQDTGATVLCSSDTSDGVYTKINEDAIGAEGNAFMRCNGMYYITKTATVDVAYKGLTVLEFYNHLNRIGFTKQNVWCSKSTTPPFSWGQIVALSDGDYTRFLMIVSSYEKWPGDNVYGYGDMWIYKAKEQEVGIEFIEDNILKF